MTKYSTNLEYYSNIRDEYQTQLINILKGPFYNGLRNIYQNVKQDSLAKSDRHIMKNFQISLKNIPVWNQDIIELVGNQVIEKADCDYYWGGSSTFCYYFIYDHSSV